MDSYLKQKEHFDKIILDYDKHYGNNYSQRYREQFIYPYLFKNVELRNKQVLEVMSGSGHNTEFLISQGAEITCLDISLKATKILSKRFPNVNTICSAIERANLPKEYYDYVIIVGGFHHVRQNIESVINEIFRILKKGGQLCFFEPHQSSIPDLVRKIWYPRDKYFAVNEQSIDIKTIKDKFQDKFTFLTEYYSGNLAYLFVYNSLIFRIPVYFKKYYSRTLFVFESFIKQFQGRRLSCFVICQWKKK